MFFHDMAISSLVNALLLRPLPLSCLSFKGLRSQNASFTDMAVITGNQVNYSHRQKSEQISLHIVLANFLSAAWRLEDGFAPRLRQTSC